MNWLKRWLFRTPAPAPIAEVSRAPMRISSLAVTMAGPGDNAQPIETFRMPPKPPGLKLPTGMAMDENLAITGLYNWATDHGPFEEGIGFFGYAYLAQLSQRAEYRMPCERLAKEMTRKWIRVTATGEDLAEKVEAMTKALERFGVRQIFRKAIEQDSYFGRAHIFIDVGAGGAELQRPLIPKARVGAGGVKGFRNVEALWAYPLDYDTSNPLRADFYVPQKWVVMTDTVHRSRLLTIVSRPMPDLLKPAYQFGGVALTQLAKPYVDNWLTTRQAVNDITQAFSQMELQTDMSQVLAGDGGESLFNRVDFFNRTRSNRGTMVTDKATESLNNIAVPLTTLDMLQAQSQEHMAAVFQMPLIVLFSITPTGLNASSDGEIKVFETWIHSQQEDVIRPPLQVIFDLVQLDEFGAVDPALGFEFVPLSEESPADVAARRKIEADTDAVYITNGVIHPDEVRERIARDETGVYNGLDLAAEAPGLPDPAEEFDDPEDG